MSRSDDEKRSWSIRRCGSPCVAFLSIFFKFSLASLCQRPLEIRRERKFGFHSQHDKEKRSILSAALRKSTWPCSNNSWTLSARSFSFVYFCISSLCAAGEYARARTPKCFLVIFQLDSPCEHRPLYSCFASQADAQKFFARKGRMFKSEVAWTSSFCDNWKCLHYRILDLKWPVQKFPPGET